MINLNKKDAVADAVKSLLKQEAIDANDRTKDVIGGTVKTKRKDDVGPGADGKSSKVRLKSEEVEQIDELSKTTLKSYQDKAMKTPPSKNGNWVSRISGVARSAEKLAKEEVEQIDELSKDTLKSYAKKAGAEATGVKGKHLSPEKSNSRFAGHRKAVERLAKEEVEQIDELSKSTLSSYTKKAVDDVNDRAYSSGNAAARGHHASASRNDSKVFKRVGNINKAVDRLAKEEVEQIDELSKTTLGKYVRRAGFESGQQGFKAGKAHANDEKETFKKHTDTFYKRQNGISSAIRRLAKEEVEQIDELSKDTLDSYVKKAVPQATDSMEKSHKHAVLAAQSKATGSTRLATVNQNVADKAQAKANKRVGGIIKATGRIHGESVEQKLACTSPESGVVKTRGPVALKAFKAKLEENSIYDDLINEVLSKDADAGTWIKDFVNSDDPKFAGKSKEQRKKQALAAYYAKQRNEEVESIEEAGIVDTIKKGVKAVGKALSHGSDEDMRKDLQKKMGAKPEQQNGKKSMAKYNEEAEQIDEISNAVLDPYKEKAAAAASTAHQAGDHAKGLKRTIGAMTAVRKSTLNTMKAGWAKRDATVKEGWDDMLKDVKSKNEPKPSGDSGVKKGSRYGGGKQKPEQDDKKVNEGKDPGMDAGVGSQPDFATNDSKPMKVAKTLAKKTMVRMKSEMLGKAPGNN